MSLRRADHSSRGVLPTVVCPMSVIAKPRKRWPRLGIGFKRHGVVGGFIRVTVTSRMEGWRVAVRTCFKMGEQVSSLQTSPPHTPIPCMSSLQTSPPPTPVPYMSSLQTSPPYTPIPYMSSLHTLPPPTPIPCMSSLQTTTTYPYSLYVFITNFTTTYPSPFPCISSLHQN